MPTDKPRITFTLDEATLKAVEDYKFRYRMKNQSQAILSLIDIGMARIKAEDAKTETVGVNFGNSYSPTLTDAFEKMEKPSTSFEEKGDEISREEMAGLLRKLGYIREGDTLSKNDWVFLDNLFGMLDAWFERKGL